MDQPGFEILYQSDPCLVVNKPAGIATQAPAGIDSLEVRVRRFLLARKTVAGPVYLGVPHRLDRPASGVIVFARRRRAARQLAEQFQRREVRKVYWALVEGRVRPDRGRWEDWLRKIPGVARSERVAPGHPEGRRAVLHYTVVGEGAWGCWLKIDLQTGRTHQVRVRAASRGHPVLGDLPYGARGSFGPPHEDPRRLAIALHAREVTFRHPRTQSAVTVTAPVWEAWTDFGIGGVAE